MPYGRKRSRSAAPVRSVKKRRYGVASYARARNVLRKYVRRRRNAVMIPRKLGMMQPARILVKHKLVFTRTLTLTNTQFVSTDSRFDMLRLRDVNAFTEDDNFPEEFVNYARLYQQYTVHGIKINAHIFQSSNTPNDWVYSVFYSAPDSADSTLAGDPYPQGSINTAKRVEEMLMKKGIRRKFLTGNAINKPNKDAMWHGAGYWSTNRIVQNKVSFNRREHSGTVTAAGGGVSDPIRRPAIYHKLVVPTATVHEGGTSSDYVVQYFVTFWVEWSNRRRDVGATIGDGPDPV